MQTLAWWDGAPDWKPLSDLPGLVQSTPPPLPVHQSKPLFPPLPQHGSAPQSGFSKKGSSEFAGKFASSVLLPILGLAIVPCFRWGLPFGLLGLIGLMFVFLGCYNAVLVVKSADSSGWKVALGCIAILANGLYALIAVSLAVGSQSIQPKVRFSDSVSSRSSGAATSTAWNSMVRALKVATAKGANQERIESVSKMLSQIDLRMVDPDLSRLISGLKGVIDHTLTIGLEVEAESRKIQEGTQAGGFLLGAIFGAAAAQRSDDPLNDSLQAGAVGGMIANEFGSAAMRDLEAKYRPQVEQRRNELLAVLSELKSLQPRLRSRYGRAFTENE